MDAVSNTKPYVKPALDYEEIKRRTKKMEVERFNGTLEEAGLDVDKFLSRPRETKEEQESQMEKFFQPFFMHKNEGMYADYERIKSDCEATINDYFDGKISEEELGEAFQTHLVDYLRSCDENEYPIPVFGLPEGMQKVATKVFYGEFRRELLAAAVHRNNEEGRQYLVGDRDAPLDCWKYYNADYYYKSEAAISALTDQVTDFAEAMEFEDFSIKDYKEKGLYLYYNFNSALANPFQLDQKIFDNWDTVPPKDFRWFSQSGRSTQDRVIMKGVYADGVMIEGPEEEDPSFDPTNSRRGMTWAAYRDEKGEMHFMSQDIIFDGTKDDLHKVSEFLQFKGKTDQVKEINRFLDNLMVYRHNYFLRFPMTGFSAKA